MYLFRMGLYWQEAQGGALEHALSVGGSKFPRFSFNQYLPSGSSKNTEKKCSAKLLSWDLTAEEMEM